MSDEPLAGRGVWLRWIVGIILAGAMLWSTIGSRLAVIEAQIAAFKEWRVTVESRLEKLAAEGRSP